MSADDKELLGRIWDTWGGMTERERRRVRRRHPHLGAVLDEIHERVLGDLASTWQTLLTPPRRRA